MKDSVTWMLDLDADRLPWRAHMIVEQDEDHAIAACGERGGAHSFNGWWRLPPGELPLSGPHDIHCGWTPEQVVAYRTAKGWAAMDEQLGRLLGH